MGQAKRQRRMRKQILPAGAACIYCGGLASTIDHMPPKQMFANKHRPKGMEFPCCSECNSGTKGAESVASIISRMSEDATYFNWESKQGCNLRHALSRNAPEVISEIFSDINIVYRLNEYNIFSRMVAISLTGEKVSSNLDIFSAKFGMSLYYEYTGNIIPDDGRVFSLWMTNKETALENANELLKILPFSDTLKNGKNSAIDQFGYRYNTNKTSIVFAMSYFNSSLFIINIAYTSEFSDLDAPLVERFFSKGTASIMRRGQLTSYTREKAKP